MDVLAALLSSSDLTISSCCWVSAFMTNAAFHFTAIIYIILFNCSISNNAAFSRCHSAACFGSSKHNDFDSNLLYGYYKRYVLPKRSGDKTSNRHKASACHFHLFWSVLIFDRTASIRKTSSASIERIAESYEAVGGGSRQTSVTCIFFMFLCHYLLNGLSFNFERKAASAL